MLSSSPFSRSPRERAHHTPTSLREQKHPVLAAVSPWLTVRPALKICGKSTSLLRNCFFFQNACQFPFALSYFFSVITLAGVLVIPGWCGNVGRTCYPQTRPSKTRIRVWIANKMPAETSQNLDNQKGLTSASAFSATFGANFWDHLCTTLPISASELPSLGWNCLLPLSVKGYSKERSWNTFDLWHLKNN